MTPRFSEQYFKSKEKEPDFELAVCLIRHGPKEGRHGALTEYGKKLAKRYFSITRRHMEINKNEKRKVLSSPEVRTLETAKIHQEVLKEVHGVEPVEIQPVEFLNEGGIMRFYESLKTDQEKEKWVEYIGGYNKDFPPGTPDFKPIVKNFSIWFLNEIKELKNKGGKLNIDGFSHGPVMGGIFLSIQNELREGVLVPLKKDENRRLKITDLIGKIKVLQNINFSISSKEPNIVKMYALGKDISVPLSVFEKFANNN